MSITVAQKAQGTSWLGIFNKKNFPLFSKLKITEIFKFHQKVELSQTLRMLNAEFIERKFSCAELTTAEDKRKSDIIEITKLILDSYMRLHERLQMTKGLYYNEYIESEKNRNALVKKPLKSEKEYLLGLHFTVHYLQILNHQRILSLP